MKRLIDPFLAAWKVDPRRKSLLLRGARQIGKTFAVRQLGATYQNFVEINFEDRPDLIPIFDLNLVPERIIKELSEKLHTTIDPKTTLLFFDEIQVAPKIIIALRYFYENMHDLHVIAAGSLLDFAILEVGVPVGRVSFMYMYPMSFLEFLWAMDHHELAIEIEQASENNQLSPAHHALSLKLLGQYLAVGGMPAAVKCWRDTQNLVECLKIHANIIDSYRQDFNKYAKQYQLRYLNPLFEYVPLSLGQKFKFSAVPGEFRKRDLAPCLDLLETAGIVHKVFHSAGQGIPLGAQADPNFFKVLFLDIALSQVVLGLTGGDWITDPLEQFTKKKGRARPFNFVQDKLRYLAFSPELCEGLPSQKAWISEGWVEAFVGQEILAYADPSRRIPLYYWQREARGAQAEVDYLWQHQAQVIPIEVKSGPGTTLKSLHMFLESHPQSLYGIKFSTQNYSTHEKIRSYPLYAVAKLIKKSGE